MTPPKILEDKLRLPIIASPLFIISTPTLVAAQCKAGIIGAFPALNARPPELLDEWLTQLTEELARYQDENPDKIVAPFAVNQICHHSNDRLEYDVEMCVKHKVPVVITSLRAPKMVVDAVHSYGGVVFHDVINLRHARKAAAEGVDGLILVCSGAGGHAGTLSPFALTSEVRKFFDGTILIGGSIANGHSVLGAQAMGADYAYMGTRFIAAEEANADENYKQMLIETAADDIVYTNLFTGVHGNYLRPSIKNAGLDPDNLPVSDPSKMNFGSGGNTKAKAWKDIWGCGQGIGSIEDAPSVATIVDRLEEEYNAAKAELMAKSA